MLVRWLISIDLRMREFFDCMIHFPSKRTTPAPCSIEYATEVLNFEQPKLLKRLLDYGNIWVNGGEGNKGSKLDDQSFNSNASKSIFLHLLSFQSEMTTHPTTAVEFINILVESLLRILNLGTWIMIILESPDWIIKCPDQILNANEWRERIQKYLFCVKGWTDVLRWWKDWRKGWSAVK